LAKTPDLWTLAEVERLPRHTTVAWASPSVAERIFGRLGFAPWKPGQPFPSTTRNLVVAGGGTMLDEAKRIVHDVASGLRLIAIPTVWGSGAEASPVVVLNRAEGKEIRMDPGYLPAARAVWEELASTVSADRARHACGDAWAHALEGFLSPLADDELRQEIAGLLHAMLAVPVGNDPRWFELSAQAAAAQARSSVGLIHGIAHTLERSTSFGHARLCAVYARPVFAFDCRSDKVRGLLQRHGLEVAAIDWRSGSLFDSADYAATLPVLEREWPNVLRDRSTRTNTSLVRSADLSFFLHFA
jgi:hypothetical protein